MQPCCVGSSPTPPTSPDGSLPAPQLYGPRDPDGAAPGAPGAPRCGGNGRAPRPRRTHPDLQCAPTAGDRDLDGLSGRVDARIPRAGSALDLDLHRPEAARPGRCDLST